MDGTGDGAPQSSRRSPEPPRHHQAQPLARLEHSGPRDLLPRLLGTGRFPPVAGTTDPETVWERHIEPGLDDYMGPVFEEICRAAMHARPELLPCEPFRTGSWWSADARDQVDVVALSGQGELLVGECKWGSVGARDLGALRRRASLFAAELDGISRVHCALFSGRGVSDESVRKAAESGEVLLFGPEDLFPPAA